MPTREQIKDKSEKRIENGSMQIIALVLGGFLSVRLVKADAYELQQNIFFTETDEWHISLL